MRVFISWSRQAANTVAVALAAFISECIQAVKPWTSEEIPKGEPWSDAILTKLEELSVVKTSCSASFVAMVEPADAWQADDVSAFARLCGSGFGRILAERVVIAVGVVVVDIESQDLPQMTLAGDDEVVHALAAQLRRRTFWTRSDAVASTEIIRVPSAGRSARRIVVSCRNGPA